MFVTSSLRVTESPYSYGCPILSAALVYWFFLHNHVVTVQHGCATLDAPYVGYLYVENRWITLHFRVSNLISSLCSLALFTESLCYTILMDAAP